MVRDKKEKGEKGRRRTGQPRFKYSHVGEHSLYAGLGAEQRLLLLPHSVPHLMKYRVGGGERGWGEGGDTCAALMLSNAAMTCASGSSDAGAGAG